MPERTQFENKLERLLAESAQSPAARPEFYRELMHSQVLVVPHEPVAAPDDSPGATATLKMATIVHEGTPYVPFYLAEKFLPPRTRYVGLSARTFFEITKGSHLVLNPGAQHGKLFAPDEIALLLSGRLLQAEKEFQMSPNAEVIVGSPKIIPPKLLGELAALFAQEPAVLRAWLGWYHNPALEKNPGYLLALETPREDGFRELAGRTALVLKAVGTGGEYCDIVRYEGSGVTGYFRSVDPFFAKPLWSRVRRSLFG